MLLLYITFIDINKAPESGSAVRPQKMLEAFREIGCEVKLLEGLQNRRAERRKKVREVIRWLDTNKPDICYVEPPSGPFFNQIDHALLKKVHRMNVPIGLFYRDAYWRFPQFARNGKKWLGFWEEGKSFVIKMMQKRDYFLFQKNCDHLFFPSKTMMNYFRFSEKSALPPGCVLRNIDYDAPFIPSKNPLRFLFVGGAAINYGTALTLEAFRKANKDGVKAKLTYICPREQWEGIKDEVSEPGDHVWLNICHVSGDKQLEPFYQDADITLLTAPKTEYRDFAVPIKIFEYISYNKPILVTNCTETEKIVLENKIGWSVRDRADVIAEKIIDLYLNQEQIRQKKENCKKACMKNLWQERAKEVITCLDREYCPDDMSGR